MTLSEITVRQFMRCLFNKDYTGVDDWETLYTDYIDLSGLGETRQLGLVITIHNLQCRLSFISGFIETQKQFVIHLGAPAEDLFEDLRKYGYVLSWDAGYPKLFEDQLRKVESREKRNIAELDILMQELKALKNTGKHAEKPNDRAEFIRMLNSMEKQNYKIDRDKTDMETLAIMIRQYGEDIEAQNNAANN